MATLAPDWQALYDKLPTCRLRLGLSGFLRYCSATGIDPRSVSNATVEAFIAYVKEVQFTVKPNDLHKHSSTSQTKTPAPRKRGCK